LRRLRPVRQPADRAENLQVGPGQLLAGWQLTTQPTLQHLQLSPEGRDLVVSHNAYVT
jgi:hypothetical protein